jgi:hypothetical protein
MNNQFATIRRPRQPGTHSRETQSCIALMPELLCVDWGMPRP